MTQLRNALGAALQSIIHGDTDTEHSLAGGVVTKWVVGMEVATPDGERILWMVAADGMKQWETLGILDLMAARERDEVGFEEDE